MEEGDNPTTYGVCTGEDYGPSRRKIFLSHNSSACADEQDHSDAKFKGVDEHRETGETGSGQWNVTSALDDRHLHRMRVIERTASSRSWQNVGLRLQVS